MHTMMVFNVQKDRDHSVQMREVQHFARGGKDRASNQTAGLISFNEVYHLGKELSHTLEAEGYGVHHPAEKAGQNWNAAGWDESFWDCLDQQVILVAEDGYQNLPPRWLTYQLLQNRGNNERLCWGVAHYPPSWELGIIRGNVPERVANAKEMNRKITAFMLRVGKQHPHAHRLVTADFNCSSLNTRNPEYPAVWYPKHMGLQTSWTPPMYKMAGGGTLGHRPVDDMFHSRGVHVKSVELADFERSDHEPPIFGFTLDNLRR